MHKHKKWKTSTPKRNPLRTGCKAKQIRQVKVTQKKKINNNKEEATSQNQYVKTNKEVDDLDKHIYNSSSDNNESKNDDNFDEDAIILELWRK